MTTGVNKNHIVEAYTRPPYISDPNDFMSSTPTHGWQVCLVLDITMNEYPVVKFIDFSSEKECDDFIHELGFINLPTSK